MEHVEQLPAVNGSGAAHLPTIENLSEAVEKVMIEGDLSQLTSEQRVQYYNCVCKSLGLNPYTKPFEYIKLNGKLTLYAKRDCGDQLRRLYDVSIVSLEKTITDKLCIVTATAEYLSSSGRVRRDTSTGVLCIAGLHGNNMANALMKAETKAKRRVTLSICGLGFLDESEVGVVEEAQEERRERIANVQAGRAPEDNGPSPVVVEKQPDPELEAKKAAAREKLTQMREEEQAAAQAVTTYKPEVLDAARKLADENGLVFDELGFDEQEGWVEEALHGFRDPTPEPEPEPEPKKSAGDPLLDYVIEGKRSKHHGKRLGDFKPVDLLQMFNDESATQGFTASDLRKLFSAVQKLEGGNGSR